MSTTVFTFRTSDGKIIRLRWLSDFTHYTIDDLIRERERVQRDKKYRAGLLGLTPHGRKIIEVINEEIEDRLEVLRG